MLIETVVIGAGAIAVRKGLVATRQRRAEALARTSWLHALYASREISDQLSGARKAMVDEARRQRRVESATERREAAQ